MVNIVKVLGGDRFGDCGRPWLRDLDALDFCEPFGSIGLCLGSSNFFGHGHRRSTIVDPVGARPRSAAPPEPFDLTGHERIRVASEHVV